MLHYILLATLLLGTASLHSEPLNGFSISYDNQRLLVLNQQKLPQQEEWIDVQSVQQMHEIISSLKVRGAPMIGIAAICALAQMADRNAPKEAIAVAAHYLRSSRPTAVNLSIYLDRILRVIESSDDHCKALLNEVSQIFYEDIALCDSMAEAGAALIADEESILTYCNTGSLATAGIGTALGVIKKAYFQGKKIHVYVCETRPLLQGGRLTAWELEKLGIPYTLICDNAAATLMSQGKVDRVLVGADRIAVNGDTANKIGTYALAVLSQYHHIPFHVVAPYTTIDVSCPGGHAIVIEERAPKEVRGVSGAFGTVIWSPENAPVYNPAFDVTPSELVTSYILDQGNILREDFVDRFTGVPYLD